MTHWALTPYEVDVLVSTKNSLPLHRWQQWQFVAAGLDALFVAISVKPSLRSQQATESRRTWLPFGRLTWSDAANRAWTERYQSDSALNVRFFSTEIWSPHWASMFRERKTPDVFVHVEADALSTWQSLVIAIREPLAARTRRQVQATVAAAASVLSGSVHHQGKAPWALGLIGDGFSNGMSDRGAHSLVRELPLVAA